MRVARHAPVPAACFWSFLHDVFCFSMRNCAFFKNKLFFTIKKKKLIVTGMVVLKQYFLCVIFLVALAVAGFVYSFRCKSFISQCC